MIINSGGRPRKSHILITTLTTPADEKKNNHHHKIDWEEVQKNLVIWTNQPKKQVKFNIGKWEKMCVWEKQPYLRFSLEINSEKMLVEH